MQKSTIFNRVLGYNDVKRVKKRIDNLLFKSLVFKNAVGQKVKIIDIPVLDKNNPNYFLVQARLQIYMNQIYASAEDRPFYSFKEYMKRMTKWTIYEEVYQSPQLLNNA